MSASKRRRKRNLSELKCGCKELPNRALQGGGGPLLHAACAPAAAAAAAPAAAPAAAAAAAAVDDGVAPPPQKHTISLARRISLVSRPCPLKCKPYPASLQHCTDLLPVQASMSDTEEAAAPQARVCALHSSHMRAPTVYFRHICARPPSIYASPLVAPRNALLRLPSSASPESASAWSRRHSPSRSPTRGNTKQRRPPTTQRSCCHVITPFRDALAHTLAAEETGAARGGT